MWRAYPTKLRFVAMCFFSYGCHNVLSGSVRNKLYESLSIKVKNLFQLILHFTDVLNANIYLKNMKKLGTTTHEATDHWQKAHIKIVLSYEKLPLQTFNTFCLIHFSITKWKTAHWLSAFDRNLQLSQCVRTMAYYHLIFCSLRSSIAFPRKSHLSYVDSPAV